ncbi:MAG TPA: PBP1A family penicillin-binding protein [Candidatus Sulfotelmatobacter sp.]|jgi:1A family penicillin-binding protein|nr:PBP1A family penicillin-binding protein [Candidatus Sulfotelmatobacter sp.]
MHPRSRLKKRSITDFKYKHQDTKRLKKINWKTALHNLFKKRKKFMLYVLLLFLVFMILIPPATYLYFAQDLKSKDSVINRQETGLTLMDRNGQTFYTFDLAKSFSYISISDIPVTAQHAVVATEDKNFYTNPGFSITGILRAFLTDILAGHIVEGGSTITQELAKNAFLNQSRNILRKYQELVLAAELNRRFNKQDILEMYLNSVYFGEGAFGIQNAAEAYFGIPAKNLDLAQSALLIGVLPAPSAYSPLSNPSDKAIQRQHIVLSAMIQDGYITQDQANQAESESLHYNPNKTTSNNILAPHFANYVRDQLIKQYSEERIIRDGFRVTTTLDKSLQTYAEGSVKTQVTRLKYNNASNGAAIALDPKNGQILAMVGSYDWNDPNYGQTNMTITPRQPGSAFKPIIYIRGLEDKIITPATILQDVQTTFDGGYKPHDYDYRYRGDVTVRRALANSLNIPAVEVMQKVGMSNGIDEAQKLGIDTLDTNHNYGLSLVLGSGEVPLIEMTNAYATFADQGVYHKPIGIIVIKDKYGNIVQTPTNFFSIFQYLNPMTWFVTVAQNGNQVLSKEAAYLITSILSDNTTRAEEFDGALTINRPAAVKTGTTENFRDALTIGYTPSLVVGVWVGNNDNKPMDDIAGSLGAAPIWRNMMEYYLMGNPVEQFQRPTFILSETICPGAAGGYLHTYNEYFIAGTQIDSCGQPTTFPTFTPAPTGPTPTTSPTSTQNQPTSIPAPQITSTPVPTPTSGIGVTPISLLTPTQ